MSKTVKPNTQPKNSIQEVSLDDLVENDYNPRKTFSDAKMQRLVDSIEKVGLVEPLVARDLGDGTYEVIAGVRRLRAMQKLDYDQPIPINVLDVDVEQAKLIALTENLEREQLTPMEEAQAFGEFVDIEVPRSDAEKMDGIEFRIEEDAQGRDRYYVNYRDYIEYINGEEEERSSVTSIRSPSASSASAQEAANTIPGVTAGHIQHRLQILLLPTELRSAVDNGQITISVVEQLVRFREVGDVEQMHELMLKYGKDDRFRGSNPEISRLQDKITDELDELEKRESRESELVGKWMQKALERREKLQRTVSNAVGNEQLQTLATIQSRLNSDSASLESVLSEVGAESELVEYDEETDTYELVGTLDVSDLPKLVGVVDNGRSLIQRARDVQNAASTVEAAFTSGVEDRLDERLSEKRGRKQDITQTADRMESEDLGECPHCHSTVDAPTLREEASQLQDEIDSLEKAYGAISDVRNALSDIDRQVKRHRRDYEDSIRSLMSEEVGDSGESVLVVEVDGESVGTKRLSRDVSVDAIDGVSGDDVDSILDDAAYLEVND